MVDISSINTIVSNAKINQCIESGTVLGTELGMSQDW